MKIKVFSEFGRLREVLVHRPGVEVENLTPDLLERLLFDDIPFLRKAREEHDRFVSLLRSHGVKVLYIEDLATEVVAADKETKKQFVEQFIEEAGVDSKYRKTISDFYYSLSEREMIDAMIGGVDYLTLYKKGLINKLPNKDAYPFLSDPLPNILFQRDPFASVGNGITMHAMKAVTRRRETIFADYVFKYHPRFDNEVKRYYERDEKNTLEGGDVMVLNKKTLLVGHTERTEMKAIQTVARNVLGDKESSFESVYAIEVPKKRAFMHLDTVMTCCDFGVFIVHPTIFDHEDEFKIYKVTGSETKEINKSLSNFLEDVLGYKPKFIRCGGDSSIAAGREQ
nr:arginine deiminase-like [Lytechinus pictus]